MRERRIPVVRRTGAADYRATLESMRAFTATRDDATRDELWVVEHPPVYTLGQAGRDVHLRRAVDAPVVRVERGGQITYHGPGQLVVYPLVDLRRNGIKVHAFVSLLERAVVRTLATYNLAASLEPGMRGVFVRRAGRLAKIAAVGLKITNGRSLHGLSLNVAMDLSAFDAIDVCGYEALESVDLRSLGVTATLDDVAAVLVDHLLDELDRATG